MKTLVSILALGLVVAFSAPAFAGTTKDASRVYEGRHALGCLCKEVHQGHVMQRGRQLRSAPR